MVPRVSICLPNLNTLPFLRERFDTIFAQTLRDWELFVYDSQSDDGAWDLIRKLATGESRMRVAQGPREGPYPAWNECVRQTKAEYVYIATSDDTMSPDCLEKMVAALERHPDCDLAHCPLHIIDDTGAAVLQPAWPECTVFGHGIGALLHRPHVRRAPYDGLLHLTGSHVYFSITQLMIRRSLFRRIGDFPSTWGSFSDFNWEMKASMVANTVHVPDTWASWRIHADQATPCARAFPADYGEKQEAMIQNALQACEPHLEPAVIAGLNAHWLNRTREMRAYFTTWRRRTSALGRRWLRLSQMVEGLGRGRADVFYRALGRRRLLERAATETRLWLDSLGLNPVSPNGSNPGTDKISSP